MQVKGEAMIDLVEQFIGKTIGEYYLTQLLGQGKLSAVYAAQWEGHAEQVMLTIFLLPADCQGIVRERFMARFMQHAHAVCQLRHPHIVSTYSYGEQDGYPYLVTPMIEGETIASLLKKQQRCSPDLTLSLLRQIAEALDYAHAHHVMHGTLKASNILLVRNEAAPASYMVMVAGFGLAHMLEIRGIGQVAHQYPGLFSIAGTLLTNPAYIAPEVIEGGSFDERADIYALGILTFEMLCGQPPFTASNPFDILHRHTNDRIPTLQSITSDVPVALDIALQRALERDPLQRLQVAGKFVTAFERVLSVIKEAAKPVVAHTGPVLPIKIHLALLDDVLPLDEGIAIPGITATHITSVFPTFPINTQVRLPGSQKTEHAIAGPASIQKQISEMVTPKNVQTNSTILQKKSQEQSFPWTQATTDKTKSSLSSTAPRVSAKIIIPPKPRASRPDPGRRRIIKAVNGVVTAGVLIGGGLSIWNLLQSRSAAQTSISAIEIPSTPTATPPSQLISAKLPDKNAALNFTDPLTHKLGILIRLPDNSLVAYERACTHEGTPINYNPKSHTLICPNHQAQFDPAQKGAVLVGPATKPIAPIAIQVSSDGKISVRIPRQA